MGLFDKLFLGRKTKKQLTSEERFSFITEEAIKKNISEWDFVQEEKEEVYFTSVYLNNKNYLVKLIKNNIADELNAENLQAEFKCRALKIQIPEKVYEHSLEINIIDGGTTIREKWADVLNKSAEEITKDANMEGLLKLYYTGQTTNFLRMFYKKIDTEYQQLKKS